MAAGEELHVVERNAWRAWLKKHGAKTREVWLVFDKKHTGRPVLDYGAAVEEALCFGWIDGMLKRLDDERYARRFTPRRDGSQWSKLNKERAKRMIDAGLMTEVGLAKVKAAKASGAWQAEAGSGVSAKVEMAMPEELATALKRNKKAKAFFEGLTLSHRNRYMGWVGDAKKSETRERRAREAVERLVRGDKLGLK
jgi:uncharacterized protein YdeI (YjbR/CyaY-like superfamily)